MRLSMTILILFTVSLFSTPMNTWNKEGFFVNLNTIQLQRNPYLLKNQTMLQNFYKNHQNRPLWLSNKGIKGKKVMQLLSSIQRDVTLNPRSSLHKEAQKLKKDLEKQHNNETVLQLELELTTLYYHFLQHTIYGEIDWAEFDSYLSQYKKSGIDANWVRYPLHFDLIKLMSQEDILATLRQVSPKKYQYKKLHAKLYELYKIKWKGGWGKLPAFSSLKKGQTSPAVKQLRQRLRLSGDYKECSNSKLNNYFDTCLQNAVKHFQKRHNSTVDGVVGSGTRKLLNVSVDNTINKLLLNIDRIKWLPRNVTERHIIVNIPEYILHYYEYEKEVKKFRVIVGDPQHPTPIFSDTLSYITLNPYWKLPPGIIKREVIPAMVKNPNYIKKQGLEAHETWEEDSPIVSLKDIDWRKYLQKENKFPYRLMQAPGPKNALGKIKFKFPNNFSVYLHDTPGRHLFKKKKRAFSHGCVRLSKPFLLLESLAKYEPHITSEEVQNILSSKKKKEIDLTHDIPIHLVYLTVWVDANNQLIFADDIYGYDQYQKRFIR